jgi:hypothetical protein
MVASDTETNWAISVAFSAVCVRTLSRQYAETERGRDSSPSVMAEHLPRNFLPGVSDGFAHQPKDLHVEGNTPDSSTPPNYCITEEA